MSTRIGMPSAAGVEGQDAGNTVPAPVPEPEPKTVTKRPAKRTKKEAK